MKNISTKKRVNFYSGQTDWKKIIGGHIGNGACPHCGVALNSDTEVIDKDYGKLRFIGCSNCDQDDYMCGYMEVQTDMDLSNLELMKHLYWDDGILKEGGRHDVVL